MTDKDMEVALGVFHQFEEIKGDFNECAEIRGRNIKRIAAAIREAETEALERAAEYVNSLNFWDGDLPDLIRALKSKSE